MVHFRFLKVGRPRPRALTKMRTHRVAYYVLTLCSCLLVSYKRTYFRERALEPRGITAADSCREPRRDFLVPELKYDTLNAARHAKTYGPLKGEGRYLSNMGHMLKLRERAKCASMSNVLDHILKNMSACSLPITLAYGSMLHLVREGGLMQGPGAYFDDDVDLWVSPLALFQLLEMETEILSVFGWATHIFVQNEVVTFVQIQDICGNKPVGHATKSASQEPGIEVYVLYNTTVNGEHYMHDFWQASLFSKDMIYPLQDVAWRHGYFPHRFNSNFRLPARSTELLTCLYDEWMRKSSKHAAQGLVCEA